MNNDNPHCHIYLLGDIGVSSCGSTTDPICDDCDMIITRLLSPKQVYIARLLALHDYPITVNNRADKTKDPKFCVGWEQPFTGHIAVWEEESDPALFDMPTDTQIVKVWVMSGWDETEDKAIYTQQDIILPKGWLKDFALVADKEAKAPFRDMKKDPESYVRTRTHDPEEGTMDTDNQCRDNTCDKPHMERSMFCAAHRCAGITAKNQRCKSHSNCGIKHARYMTEEQQYDEDMAEMVRHDEGIAPAPGLDPDNNKEDTQVVDTNKAYFHRPDEHIVAATGTKSIQTIPEEMKKIVMWITLVYMMALKEKYGDRLVIASGMAEGFDKVVALCAIRLGIPLICVIPNAGYKAYYWGPPNQQGKGGSLTGKDQRKAFDEITSKAIKVVYVMEDIHKPTGNGVYWHPRTNSLGWKKSHGVHANFVRNTYMMGIAHEGMVWEAGSPGTAHAVSELKRLGKDYTVISPSKEA